MAITETPTPAPTPSPPDPEQHAPGDKEMTVLLAVNLSVPSSQAVTVGYATADGTATAGSDYLPAAGTLTFNPGETRQTVAVTLPKDLTQEPIVEAFFVNLSNVSRNAVILRRGVVGIVDDDNNQGHHYGNWGALAAAGNGFFDTSNISAASAAAPKK